MRLQILGVIADYLFTEQKFAGDETNFHDPENSYLNRVLDRRKGNHISLSVVYLLLARRLRLPVAGIGLPGYFVCRYQSSRHEIYIDPFRKGRLLAKADCVKYVVQLQHRFDEGCLAPVSARRILLRICANLEPDLHPPEVPRPKRTVAPLPGGPGEVVQICSVEPPARNRRATPTGCRSAASPPPEMGEPLRKIVWRCRGPDAPKPTAPAAL